MIPFSTADTACIFPKDFLSSAFFASGVASARISAFIVRAFPPTTRPEVKASTAEIASRMSGILIAAMFPLPMIKSVTISVKAET